ncbi:MAG TPA: hypothetical protein EYO58_10510, partial [Flavobacteriales bacterium]|nr:hypothetical protein [Flavobacteriales bacterium]
QIKALEAQMKTQFKKAFMDLLRKNLESDKPDWEWVKRLHQELRDRICNLTPRRSDIIDDIYDKMDSDIFYNMVSNNVYTGENLLALVNFVFSKIHDLEAPVKNVDTDAKRDEVVLLFQNPNSTIATIVPVFIQSANDRLDCVYKDREIFMKMLQKEQTKK